MGTTVNHQTYPIYKNIQEELKSKNYILNLIIILKKLKYMYIYT